MGSDMKLCECGCGDPSPISSINSRLKGWVKGQPKRFIHNHHRRLSGVEYIIDKQTGCWIWQRSKDTAGYGLIGIKGRLEKAHRHYYKKIKEEIPEGLQLDHLCRNRDCVNPDHLEVVTNAENQRRGARAKLSYEKVELIKELRLSGESARFIGNKFGVCHGTILKASKGISWERR